jgi:hypothetical protein
MQNDTAYREMCLGLLEAFPSSAPGVVTCEGKDGDFGHAQEMFALHGSNWNCEAIFTNRSLIMFVNDATYLFLLPRLICCSMSNNGIDPDIVDYVMFALRAEVPRFSKSFSFTQRAALIPPLQYLLARVLEEYSDPEDFATEMRRILAALQALPEDENRTV